MLDTFSLKLVIWLVISASIQNFIGGSRQCNEMKKEKRYKGWYGRNNCIIQDIIRVYIQNSREPINNYHWEVTFTPIN